LHGNIGFVLHGNMKQKISWGKLQRLMC